MRRCALLLLGATACVAQPAREVGVDVFANDTVPVKFVVTLTGTLAMALRSNEFYLRPDKSLVLETPASLIVKQGEGTAMIASFDTTQVLAVGPIGTPPESTEVTSVVGRVVRVKRIGEEKRVSLALEKP